MDLSQSMKTRPPQNAAFASCRSPPCRYLRADNGLGMGQVSSLVGLAPTALGSRVKHVSAVLGTIHGQRCQTPKRLPLFACNPRPPARYRRAHCVKPAASGVHGWA